MIVCATYNVSEQSIKVMAAFFRRIAILEDIEVYFMRVINFGSTVHFFKRVSFQLKWVFLSSPRLLGGKIGLGNKGLNKHTQLVLARHFKVQDIWESSHSEKITEQPSMPIFILNWYTYRWCNFWGATIWLELNLLLCHLATIFYRYGYVLQVASCFLVE